MQHVQNYALSGMLGPSSALHTTENGPNVTISASGSHQPISNSNSSQVILFKHAFCFYDIDLRKKLRLPTVVDMTLGVVVPFGYKDCIFMINNS